MAPKPPTTPETSNPQGEALAFGAVAEEHLHLDGSAIDRIADLSRQAMPTINLGKDYRPAAVLPNEFKLALVPEVDTERDAPRRLKVAHTVQTAAGFIAYLERFKEVDQTLLYGTADAGRILAVIDHPTKTKPTYGDHTIVYMPRMSEAWKAWDAIDGKAMTQAAMALFLEENYIDIMEPAGASMLELAASIEAKKSGAFRSDVNLSNGSRVLTWDDKVEGNASMSGQKVAIPTKIIIRVPVFEGQGARDIHVLFRFRLDNGKLAMQFDIWRKAVVVREAFGELVKQVQDATSLRVIDGTFDAPKRIELIKA